MLGLVATGLPLMYSVPVVPDSVTARWVHVFSGSWPLVLSCCSPLPPCGDREPDAAAGVDREEHVLAGAGAEVEHP